jgi:hypothetical protein
MTLSAFKDSLHQAMPPGDLHQLLQAMWYDAKGNWESAHALAQEENSQEGAWVHAYLHRKEGDLSNATYWYHRANQRLSTKPLEEEWEDITVSLLR